MTVHDGNDVAQVAVLFARADSNYKLLRSCDPSDIPPMPIVLGEPTHVVQTRKRQAHKPHITKAEREHTPPPLAVWLVELAKKCTKPKGESWLT